MSKTNAQRALPLFRTIASHEGRAIAAATPPARTPQSIARVERLAAEFKRDVAPYCEIRPPVAKEPRPPGTIPPIGPEHATDLERLMGHLEAKSRKGDAESP